MCEGGQNLQLMVMAVSDPACHATAGCVSLGICITPSRAGSSHSSHRCGVYCCGTWLKSRLKYELLMTDRLYLETAILVQKERRMEELGV